MTRMGKVRSGRNVREDERHTVQLKIRCSEDLATKVRKVARKRSLTLADVLDAGVDALEGETRS